MRTRISTSLFLVCSLAITLGFLGGSLLHARASQAKPAPQAAASSITNDDCAVCHEDLTKAFNQNPHAILEKSPRFNKKDSCQSCHGPGEAHATNDGDKTKIVFSFKGAAKAEYNKQCLTCHKNSHDLSGFISGAHAKGGLACSDCHKVHNNVAVRSLLREPTNTLCMGCHIRMRSDFSKPFHHRIKEGAMRCTDCHQPHGSLKIESFRASFTGESACLKCHTDKNGPFVFEHASRRIRDCRACHEPHGSNNPKMLVRSTVRSLCLECHSTSKNVLTSQPPAFHDQRSPRYQNCTTCHTRIHGSNSNRRFLR